MTDDEILKQALVSKLERLTSDDPTESLTAAFHDLAGSAESAMHNQVKTSDEQESRAD